MIRMFHKELTAGIACILLLLPLGSGAQLVEEVIVTAQKREQSLQDVGISITAFSGEQIRALGYTNTTDITEQTPGLSIAAYGPTLTAVNIRGISQEDFSGHFEGPWPQRRRIINDEPSRTVR